MNAVTCSHVPADISVRCTGLECSSNGSDGGLAKHRRGYLAQHPLFEQIPALARDIAQPEYCILGEGIVRSVNAWFGPAGTVIFTSHTMQIRINNSLFVYSLGNSGVLHNVHIA